ncbi:MAG: DUF4012 domain-containing protein [Candidatus Doudnabacteria bacterium]|nr:DUF4012 domain-containing protein [Candidatus Doudnabacteria bacterium]
MAKQTKLKLYTYHNRYFNLKVKKTAGKKNIWQKIFYRVFDFLFLVGLGVIKPFQLFFKLVFGACYHTGSALISVVTKFARGVKNDVAKTFNNFPKRLGLIFNRQFARSFFIFIFIAGAAYASLQSMHLIARGLELKDAILHSAFLGNSYLNQAKDALSKENFSEAQTRFELAYKTFNRGQKDVEETGEMFNQILSILPQKQDADKLLKAAALVAQAGQDFISLQSNASSIKLSAAGFAASGDSAAKTFGNINNSLDSASQKITAASKLVNSINMNSLPASQRENFVELKSKLQILQFSLTNFRQVFAVVNNIFIGQKNVLLLFENNNELRAGGGFIGTYGSLKLNNGIISIVNISSIYDLDGQLKEIIKPPHPMLNVNDRWYLRDANWFANFSESAKSITSFFEKEGGETPDIIIAVTPSVIVDWLKITGPIVLPSYGLTLTSDNFVEQTQAITTLSNNLPTNSPKQILADLFPVLLQKLSQLDAASWPQVIESLQGNLNSKQIVLYAKDPGLQQQLSDFHWTGNLENSDRDYLSIVSSNLGGTKTDLFIEQKSELVTTVEADGSIINELSITRTNKLPVLDKTDNVSFMRIFVPLGSKLVSNTGFGYKNIQYPDNINYKLDDDAYDWESGILQDTVTGTNIGVESGKTFFGNWITVRGGESKTIKLVYKLPFKLQNIDRYSLMLQKQIGSLAQDINWKFNFSGRQIAWKNFDSENLDASSLNSDIILSKDYFLGAVLQKR